MDVYLCVLQVVAIASGVGVGVHFNPLVEIDGRVGCDCSCNPVVGHLVHYIA